MSEPKTKPTGEAIESFLSVIEPPSKQADARVLVDLFTRVTAEQPMLWTGGIVGFGEYKTVYANGRRVHWMRTGFSPRKAKHSLYLMGGYCDDAAAASRAEALTRLGKHSQGKSCLYINKLADVDLGVLEEMIANDWAVMKRIYPDNGTIS